MFLLTRDLSCLRVELGSECLEHFLPVLMSGQAAARREANHVAGVELSLW
jgi:hypothetical protein